MVAKWCKFITAVKRLIASKIKVFFIYHTCVCIVYIYYVFINTDTYSVYFENIYVFACIHFIHIIYIIYTYRLLNIQIYFFLLKYIHACVCICTHIYYVNKNLFWMRLIVINWLTALTFIFTWPLLNYKATKNILHVYISIIFMLNIYIHIYNIFSKIIQICTSEVVHFHTIYAKMYTINAFPNLYEFVQMT